MNRIQDTGFATIFTLAALLARRIFAISNDIGTLTDRAGTLFDDHEVEIMTERQVHQLKNTTTVYLSNLRITGHFRAVRNLLVNPYAMARFKMPPMKLPRKVRIMEP